LNEKSSGSRSRKQRLTAVGTRCADHVTPFYPQKLALTSPTGGGLSVGIVRVRTKSTEFLVYYCTTINFNQKLGGVFNTAGVLLCIKDIITLKMAELLTETCL